MNIHKHMEAIFFAALGTIGAAAAALDSVPEAKARTTVPAARSIATPGTMAVVVIRAPRLPRRP